MLSLKDELIVQHTSVKFHIVDKRKALLHSSFEIVSLLPGILGHKNSDGDSKMDLFHSILNIEKVRHTLKDRISQT